MVFYQFESHKKHITYIPIQDSLTEVRKKSSMEVD